VKFVGKSVAESHVVLIVDGKTGYRN